jgi:hypothetical protein
MPNLTIGGQFYSIGEELPDEGLIMAYVDGELDEEGRRYVEELLSRSAEARETAAMMRASSALLRSAFLDDPTGDISSIGIPEPSVSRHPVKGTYLSRPVTGAVSTRVRLQRKA